MFCCFFSSMLIFVNQCWNAPAAAAAAVCASPTLAGQLSLIICDGKNWWTPAGLIASKGAGVEFHKRSDWPTSSRLTFALYKDSFYNRWGDERRCLFLLIMILPDYWPTLCQKGGGLIEHTDCEPTCDLVSSFLQASIAKARASLKWNYLCLNS